MLSSKQEKTIALQSELSMLNSMLPNSVWIPFDFENTMFNICVNESAVLNSKDKVSGLNFDFGKFSPNNFLLNVSYYHQPVFHNF